MPAVAASITPRLRPRVHGEPCALQQHRQLCRGDGLGRRLLGEGEQEAKPTPLEAAADEVETDAVAHQSAQLGLIALDEDDAVAVIRLRAEPIGLGQETIKSFPVMRCTA